MKTSLIHFSKRNTMGRNILGRWTIVERGAHILDITYTVNIGNINWGVYRGATIALLPVCSTSNMVSLNAISLEDHNYDSVTIMVEEYPWRWINYRTLNALNVFRSFHPCQHANECSWNPYDRSGIADIANGMKMTNAGYKWGLKLTQDITHSILEASGCLY